MNPDLEVGLVVLHDLGSFKVSNIRTFLKIYFTEVDLDAVEAEVAPEVRVAREDLKVDQEDLEVDQDLDHEAGQQFQDVVGVAQEAVRLFRKAVVSQVHAVVVTQEADHAQEAKKLQEVEASLVPPRSAKSEPF